MRQKNPSQNDQREKIRRKSFRKPKSNNSQLQKKITQVVDKRVEIKIEKLTFFTAKRSSLNYS